MTTGYRMGLMWRGSAEDRAAARQEEGRFAGAAAALAAAGIAPEAVVYRDEAAGELLEQVRQLDAVQVWVNPIEGGQHRSGLDAMLREAAAAGVLVWTHPDTILKMGTKQVLADARSTSVGSDVAVYGTPEEMAAALPARLRGGPRVLKQYRGQSGSGVYKVTLAAAAAGGEVRVLLRHAVRGCPEEEMALGEAVERLRPYFASGPMIDQAYQHRLDEGMTRVYMVGGAVAGFGHQEVNALFPAAAPGEEPPQPGPRLYHPADEPRFGRMRELMERRWLGELLGAFRVEPDELPLLWDADFLLGPKDTSGEDTHVLCEINVSSVSPYPEAANAPLAAEAVRRIRAARGA